MVNLSKMALIGIFLVLAVVVTISIIFIGLLPILIGPDNGMNDDDNIMDGVPDKTGIAIAEGELVRFDESHFGEGTVRLILKDDGKYSIFFINVNINPGPELYVYLSKKASFSGTSDSPGEYLDLGLLPSYTGNFEVEIEENIVSTDYGSVLIWCKPFSVVFTYATLTPVA